MDEYIVVDGYNVIHAWTDLSQLMEESMEHARDRLVDILVDYAGFSGDRVIVVFDAHRSRHNVERHLDVNGVQVVYTREDETADSLIERLVGEMPRDGYIRVVTSDWEEQRIIFGRGAYRMTPKELRKQVKQVKEEGKEPFSQRNFTEGYLENRLTGHLRQIFEQWRRKKE